MRTHVLDWTRRHLKRQHVEYLSKLRPSARIVLDGTTAGLFQGSCRNPLCEYIFLVMHDGLVEELVETAGMSLVLRALAEWGSEFCSFILHLSL